MIIIPEVIIDESQEDYTRRCTECLKSEKIPEKQKIAICVSKYINFRS